MSTVTKSVSLAFAGALLVSGLYLGSTAASAGGSSASAPAPKLARLELNPLGMLGTPGRLKSLKMANPSIATSVPTDLMVYRVVPPTVSAEAAERAAQRFGVSGKARRDKALTIVDGANADVVLDNETGSINWITPDYETNVDPMTNRLSDEQYVSLAESFLKSRGQWADDYVLTDIGQYTVEGQPTMVEVNFGRNLNGRKWQGVGPKKSVTFGDNGKIVGMFSVWRDVEPMAKYPLVKPSQALAQVQSGDAMVSSDELNVDATADTVDLIYVNDGAGTNQKFVAPYYRFSGKTASGKPFVAVTRAIPLEYINERPDELPGKGGTPPTVGRTE